MLCRIREEFVDGDGIHQKPDFVECKPAADILIICDIVRSAGCADILKCGQRIQIAADGLHGNIRQIAGLMEILLNLFNGHAGRFHGIARKILLNQNNPCGFHTLLLILRPDIPLRSDRISALPVPPFLRHSGNATLHTGSR